MATKARSRTSKVLEAFPNRIVGEVTMSPRQIAQNPRNWRRHPQAQLDALEGALRTVGWVQRVIYNVRTGLLVDGHARVDLAMRNGETSVPVTQVDLSPEEEALVLATLDPLSAMAEADQSALDELLAEVYSDNDALQALIDQLGSGVMGEGAGNLHIPDSDDEVPNPNDAIVDGWVDKWRPELGQLWCIPSLNEGHEHRLLCGDATDPDTVATLLDGARPFLMVTDPPYGDDYDPGWRSDKSWGTEWPNHNPRVEQRVAGDARADWYPAYSLFPGDVAYVWHGAKHMAEVQAGLERATFEMRTHIIWAKQHFVVSRGHYHSQHESAFYAVRRGKSADWVGDRKQSTLWEIASLNPLGRQEERVPHATQKPIECMARPMRHHGGSGVYDPFAGSGTAILAAELTGRQCFALELDPRCLAIILERVQSKGFAPYLLDGPS